MTSPPPASTPCPPCTGPPPPDCQPWPTPGYDGVGSIHIPARQPADGRDLDIDIRTRNALPQPLRCLGERGFALLTGRWRTLQHITASPGKIGDIARAALVLTHFAHGYIKLNSLRSLQ